MIKFLAGAIFGFVLAIGASAYAAVLSGDGYLFSWTVTKDGEEICSAPFVWSATKEIECD
ncbi:MAG: hypothetical protein KF748_01245 [Xanthobacteraceae bacterium]|nr:hypothetical protein [Xanthobacteraceae bacterium]MBX3547758.1 hypothetical protein [Xanthobacteraceae bacterium]